ncbi:MAG: hypothetical protein NC033_03645 [Clostridiales bacterium]|nr:hypothetical protein [Clostridiales bacterium]
MSEKKYELSQKQKALGFALYAKKVTRQTMATIMMVLENDGQIDDMTWYIGQNPNATEEQLIAVAYQIVKEAHEGNGEN